MIPLTYGCEFEFSDIDTRKTLPKGNTYSCFENSIVNSDCLACKLYGKNLDQPFGGEINSLVSDNLQSQIDNFKTLIELFPEATVNHRTALQIHVGFKRPEDLNLKNILNFITYYYSKYKDLGNLLRPQYEKSELFGTHFYKEMIKRNQKIEDWKYDILISSKTLEELKKNFGMSKVGKYHSITIKRYAINLYKIFQETKTIEFRCFWGTTSIEQFVSCLNFVKDFCELAFENSSESLDFENYNFPKKPKFSKKLEIGWERTNVKNPRINNNLEDYSEDLF